jgi:pSer/pThr/pTyr-binding forkhead associated (FHA) protein
MREVVLTYPTQMGSEEIIISAERTSFGRGSESDHHFDDDGLSRLHATIYRDGDRIWIVDENSTNGTSVNGAKVSGSGTPINNGDSIKIGNHTTLNVRITSVPMTQSDRPKTDSKVNPVIVSSTVDSKNYILPIALITFALLIIGTAGIFVGITVFGGGKSEETRKTVGDEEDFSTPEKEKSENKTPKATVRENSNIVISNSNLDLPPQPSQDPAPNNVPSGKTYMQMDQSEKTQYVEAKSQKVARMIGNKSGGAIPPKAVEQIKKFVDAYVTRVNASRKSTCNFGDNLQATYERASKNAKFIVRDFYGQGVDPQIGLYLAMIESEHCPCLESPTHALGLFQFLASTAPDFGLDPKDRCDTELASKAAAKYMKQLSGRFGTGPLSMPLAIGSYNSGQGALSKNLETALKSNGNQERSFWTLVENAESLSKQFQLENIKYVPKFYAAAIIGENPQDFGLTIQPLSTYTN